MKDISGDRTDDLSNSKLLSKKPVWAIHRSPELPSMSPEQLMNLMNTHGSPLLVGSRSMVCRQLQRLRESLPNVDWYYAVKANRTQELLATLASNGCGFDIASYSELNSVRNVLNGVDVEILHSHPCKSPTDVRDCYRSGIRRFVFDCENELIKLAANAPQSRLLLRISIPNHSGQVAFGHRFGAELDSVVALASRSRALGMSMDGIAFHVGSQALDPSDFEVALEIARRFWDLLQANGIKLSILDIGGGFPVAYRDQAALSLDDYCRSIAISLVKRFGDQSVTIVAEPGRILCGEAVSLLTTVIGKQRRQGKLWYTIDDGRYGSFSGRYFSENTFDFLPYRRQRNRAQPIVCDCSRDDACVPMEPSMIAGPSCDGGDIVATDYWLPDLNVGDLLVVPKMGAYSAVSASEFNGMPKAEQVWIE